MYVCMSLLINIVFIIVKKHPNVVQITNKCVYIYLNVVSAICVFG